VSAPLVDASTRAVYGRAMAESIRVRRGVEVPGSAITWRAVRSASKVEVRVDLGAVAGLDAAARQRLAALAARRRDSRGRLLVTSQRTRDQSRNLEDAREKVRGLVARALVVPRRRRRTRPSAAAVEERLRGKRLRGARKRERRSGGHDED
jgi:ribosome-associated protein